MITAILMCYTLPLQSCVYLKKISIKTNVVTDEGNSRHEIGHRINDEIKVAIQNWL